MLLGLDFEVGVYPLLEDIACARRCGLLATDDVFSGLERWRRCVTGVVQVHLKLANVVLEVVHRRLELVLTRLHVLLRLLIVLPEPHHQILMEMISLLLAPLKLQERL